MSSRRVYTRSDFSRLLPPDPPTKIGNVLYSLCCGFNFNRFEAEKALHDHALNSTISVLRNGYEVIICDKWEEVPGHLNSPTRVKRYFLDTGQNNLQWCYSLLLQFGYSEPSESQAA